MKTLIIYDNTGYVYLQITGNYRLPQDGIQFLEIEIPQGKTLNCIDINKIPNEPIFEDLPISEVDILKNKLQQSQKILGDYVNSKYNALLNN